MRQTILRLLDQFNNNPTVVNSNRLKPDLLWHLVPRLHTRQLLPLMVHLLRKVDMLLDRPKRMLLRVSRSSSSNLRRL